MLPKVKFRSITEADRPMVEAWLAQDPYHKGCPPDFFSKVEDGVSLIVVEDNKGPVYIARLENVMQINLTFNPGAYAHDKEETRRVAQSLFDGLDWIKKRAVERKYKWIQGESISETLVKYFKRLNFVEVKHAFRLRIGDGYIWKKEE